MFMRGLLVGLVLVIPLWLVLVMGVGHLRGSAQRGELPAMPWSNRP